jgi:hypothetical protein
MIDVNNVINKHDLGLLKKRLGPQPVTRETVGVVLVIDELTLKELKNKGKHKVKYINTTKFINSIKDSTYVSFNVKTKSCDISYSSVSMIEHIVKNTLRYLPNDFTLTCKVEITDKNYISMLTKNGFNGSEIHDSHINMSRINDVIINDDELTGETLFYTTNSDHLSCKYTARLSESSITYLRGLPERGVTISNGKFSQKEIAGSFVTGSIDHNMVHSLDVGKYKISHDTEKVDTIPSLVTFHTHPVEAYERNNVDVGWPSKTDYISFLKVADKVNLILHIVVALEGFYVISRSRDWFENGGRFDSRVEKAINENTAFDKGINKEGDWHVDNINKIKVDGLSILKVYLIPWNEPTTIFEVFYNKEDGNCKIPK